MLFHLLYTCAIDNGTSFLVVVSVFPYVSPDRDAKVGALDMNGVYMWKTKKRCIRPKSSGGSQDQTPIADDGNHPRLLKEQKHLRTLPHDTSILGGIEETHNTVRIVYRQNFAKRTAPRSELISESTLEAELVPVVRKFGLSAMTKG